jgi:hypothetical protein
MRRLSGFLIPDLRLGIAVDGGGARSGAVLRGPVALSFKVTTHVNILVTSCQLLMVALLRHFAPGGKVPGLKPIQIRGCFAGLKSSSPC